MNQLFQIFTVDEKEAKKINASPDEPHQHDFVESTVGVDEQLEQYKMTS